MSREENGHQEVIERLTSKIREGARKAISLSSACIYKVPQEIRMLNRSAYTPHLIAIGPLHRDDPHLPTTMQHVKMSYMNNLLCRMTQGMENQEAEQKKILQECVATMEMSIEYAKKCYAEEVTLDVEMMLIDGCFILEFLYRFRLYCLEELYTEDPIFGNSATIITVQQDLLILENQIPFLVLERLFPLTLARIPNNPLKNLSLTDYVFLPLVDQLMSPAEGQSTDSTGSEKTSCWPRDCILWVSGNNINNTKPEKEVSSRSNVNYYHILHKLHHYFRPQDRTKEWGGLYLPSASELVHAGVKFVPATGNDLFKVKFTEPEGPFWWFRSARFEIPPLEVADGIELFLRNFIAFEQCCPVISQYFTSYAYLMERLMESDTDVQVLDKARVIHNKLGAPEDALYMFDNLLKEVTISEFCFADACNRATRYSKHFWPRNMAYMRSQRSQFIAFCLGFVAFGVSFAQLIVGIYSIK